ncbi:MAG: T9SS type A sorting domain-containing protein, partial [Bacteroidia bacterium]
SSAGVYSENINAPFTMAASGQPTVIDVNPINNKVYIFFGGSSPLVYKTSQEFYALTSGLSMSSLSLGTMPSVTSFLGFGISPSGRIFLGGQQNIAGYMKLFRYSDNETTWTEVTPSIDGVVSNVIAFGGSATSYRTYFAKCYSTDQGATWTTFGNVSQQTHPNDGVVYVDPIDTLTVYMTSDQGIARSENGGSIMKELDRGIEAIQVKDIDMTDDKNTAWLASKSGIRKVTNYTTSPSWSRAIFPNGDGSPYYSADMLPSDYNTAYVGNLRIYKTTDGGSNWTQKFTPESAPYSFPDTGIQNSAIEVCPYDESIVFATWELDNYRKGGLFYTTNSGSSWSQLLLEASGSGEDVDATDIIFNIEGTDTVAYVSVRYDLSTPQGRSVYRIVKSGATWTASQNMNGANTSTGSLIVATIEDLYKSPTGDTLIATGTDAGNNHPICYYKIISGTNKWTPFTTSGFPFVAGKEGKASTLGVDTVFCAVDNEIYYMVFGGSSWTLGYTYPEGTEINFVYYDELLVGTSTGLYGHVTDGSIVPSTGDYRTNGNVDFVSASNWETNPGTGWVAASTAPSSASGDILIRAGHIATVSSSLNLDECTIEAGATLQVNSGATLTLLSGTPVMDCYGTIQNAGTISGSGLKFKSGSIYTDNHVGAAVTIPAATWEDGSLCEVVGCTNNNGFSYSGSSFYNFKWNAASQTAHVSPLINTSNAFEVRNKMTIQNTGTGSISMMNGTVASNPNLNIGDSLEVLAGSFNLANNSQTISVTIGNGSNGTGNLIISGGEIIETGSANPLITFNGLNGVFVKTAGRLMGDIDFVVADTNLNLGTSILDGSTGDFSMNANAGLRIASSNGIQSTGPSGNVQVNGTRTFSTSGTYVYEGSSSQFSGSGLPSTVKNLIIDNSLGFTLSTSTSVTNALIVEAGSLSTSNKNLSLGASAYADFAAGTALNINNAGAIVDFNNRPVRLASSAIGTAKITQIMGALNNATQVTVERFIPGSTGRKYRYIAAPFTSGPSISTSWQQNIHITGSGSGGSTCPSLSANSNGFDATLTNAASMFTFNESSASVSSSTAAIAGATVYNNAWQTIPNTTATNLQVGKGYKVFIRGNREQGCSLLDGSLPAANDVTLSAKGTIQTGMFNFALTYTSSNGEGWNLVGNPYPCDINWDNIAWTKTNIDNTFWIYNPTTNNFATYNGIIGLNGGESTIASGQAFFVKANASSPVLTANESVKSSTTPVGSLFKSKIKTLKASFMKSGLMFDEMAIHFVPGASVLKDAEFDAEKMFNSNINLYSISAGKKYALNAVAPPVSEDVIELGISTTAAGLHKLVFSQLDEFTSYDVLLEDKFLGVITLLNDRPNYEFNIGSNPAEKGEARFRIIFVNRGSEDYLEKKNALMNQFNSQVSMYPNPANESTSIHASHILSPTATIIVKNIMGQEIMNVQYVCKQAELHADLDLNRLGSGVYFVEILDGEKLLSTQKLVKN